MDGAINSKSVAIVIVLLLLLLPQPPPKRKRARRLRVGQDLSVVGWLMGSVKTTHVESKKRFHNQQGFLE